MNSPGTDSFTDALTADWLIYLQNGFWEAVMDGVITGYEEDDGIVTPITGDTDLSRQLQQLVVFYAGFNVTLNSFKNLQTKFRAKAGPVEYETQQTAGLLQAVLAELAKKRALLLTQLGSVGVTESYYIDGVISRGSSLLDGLTFTT